MLVPFHKVYPSLIIDRSAQKTEEVQSVLLMPSKYPKFNSISICPLFVLRYRMYTAFFPQPQRMRPAISNFLQIGADNEVAGLRPGAPSTPCVSVPDRLVSDARQEHQ